MRDDHSRTQLAVLAHLDDLFGREHIRFWLRGGWALDFMVGRVTRPHADLDLVLWNRRRSRAHATLLASGFRLERTLPVQTDWQKDGVEITCIYLARRPDGTIVTVGTAYGLEWEWAPEALPLRRHHLGGVHARVVNPRQLLGDMEAWEEATGRPLRPKDTETLRILRDLCGLTQAD
jgi:hypothetical protein